MDKKLLIAGIFFVFIVLSGFWLSRSEKPLNVFILTIHKIMTLAALIYIAIDVYQINQLTPLNSFEIAISSITFLFFIALMTTGAMLTLHKIMPAMVLRTHQILPFLLILSTTINLYIFQVRQ